MDASNGGTFSGYTRRVLIAAGVVVLALFLWKIVDALLLAFAGVLLAVFFRGLAQRLSARTPLSTGAALAVVLLGLAALVTAAVWLLGPQVSQQVGRLAQTLPQTIDDLRQQLEQTGWGGQLLEQARSSGSGSGMGGSIFGRLTGTASRVLSVVTDVVLVLVVAIFFAVDPRLYKNGIVLLVPESRADRIREALDTTGRALWRWLMGKLLAMLFVGIFTTVGLLLIGVPLALVLGLIAAVFDFVPFVGPIVAAVPGILLALTLGPTKALYAFLVYLVAQQIEGNIVTPLVQQHEVSLPPVLVLLAVVAGGLLFGVRGIILATPLAVVALVLVRMLYVEDVLGKPVSVPGGKNEKS